MLLQRWARLTPTWEVLSGLKHCQLKPKVADMKIQMVTFFHVWLSEVGKYKGGVARSKLISRWRTCERCIKPALQNSPLRPAVPIPWHVCVCVTCSMCVRTDQPRVSAGRVWITRRNNSGFTRSNGTQHFNLTHLQKSSASGCCKPVWRRKRILTHQLVVNKITLPFLS